MARLDRSAPVRPLRVQTRGLTGRVAMDGGSAGFESSLERDFLELLDFDKTVLELQVQPFSINHEENGRLRRYTPDVKATFLHPEQARILVFEVKPEDELRRHWKKYRGRFGAAYRHCREQGWGFKIVTEKHIRTPRLANVRFLRRYMRLTPQPIIEGQLRYTMTALGATTPQALLAAAYWSIQPRMVALSVLWQMLSNGDLSCDLDSPLTMASKIWMEK